MSLSTYQYELPAAAFSCYGRKRIRKVSFYGQTAIPLNDPQTDWCFCQTDNLQVLTEHTTDDRDEATDCPKFACMLVATCTIAQMFSSEYASLQMDFNAKHHLCICRPVSRGVTWLRYANTAERVEVLLAWGGDFWGPK